MLRQIVGALSIWLVLQPIGVAASTDGIDFLALRYDLFVENEDIGDITLKFSSQAGGLVIIENTQIELPNKWGGQTFSSNSIEEFRNRTEFVSADVKATHNNTAYWSRLESNEEEIRGLFAEVESLTQRENEELAELAFIISGALVPNLGDVLSVSGALFSDREMTPQGTRFAKNSVDATLNNLPFFLHAHWHRLPDTVNLLDTESLEVTTMNIRDIGHVEVIVGDRGISARHLQLSHPGTKPMQIWLADDATSIPYIVRLIGSDIDGPYEIRLRSEMPVFERENSQ